jgi:hypothetical protein
MGWKGQPRLTRVNIRIKVVISIILKFQLGQYQGHKFGGSTRVDLIFFLNQRNLILTNKIKKKLIDFDPCFIPGQPEFLTRLGVIHPSTI